MNRKIQAYLEVLFGDMPKSKEAIELKAELSANLNDRMNDYLAEGKSETQAYSLAIANLGDVDELLEQLPKHGEKSGKPVVKQGNYQTRNAVLLAVAVLLYILCPVPIIALSIVLPGYEEFGVVAFLAMVAVATAILIFRSASTPKVISLEKQEEEPFRNPDDNRRYKTLHTTVMGVATVAYLMSGAFCGRWGSDWVVFPIAGLGLSIYKSVCQLREEDS